ncbi:Glutamine synthetase nodule isozyme [Spatholobus suberectus]|nr:Glutamine synthetase nodule isozyme [Spatholobus suberectus]
MGQDTPIENCNVLTSCFSLLTCPLLNIRYYPASKVYFSNGKNLWEFQVGPSVGIYARDEVWAACHILERITEISGAVVSFDPVPIPGDWNRAGAHTNYR